MNIAKPRIVRFFAAMHGAELGWLVALVLLQTVNLVLVKKVSIMAPHAAYVLTQLQAASSVVGYGSLLLLRVAYRRVIASRQEWPEAKVVEPLSPHSSYGTMEDSLLRNDDGIQGARENIYDSSADFREVSDAERLQAYALSRSFRHWWRVFLVVAVCFSLYNFLFRVGGRGQLVAGGIIVLINQLSIPIVMLLSFVFLSKRYRLLQYAGAIVIIGGVVVSLIPEFGTMGSHHSELWAIVIVVASTVPVAVATVYLEFHLQHGGFNIIWGWCWINVFQFLVGLPLVFALPLQGTAFSDIWASVADGASCLFLAQNTYSDDQCGTVGLWYLVYFVFNIAFNISLGWVLKLSSAALYSVASTVALPLSNIAFSLRVLMGDDVTPWSYWDLAALAIVVVGLVLFRFRPDMSAAAAPSSRRKQRVKI